jgi:hypothetical protein
MAVKKMIAKPTVVSLKYESFSLLFQIHLNTIFCSAKPTKKSFSSNAKFIFYQTIKYHHTYWNHKGRHRLNIVKYIYPIPLAPTAKGL